MIIELNIDLHPTNVPFVIQATKADGTVIDPTNLANALNLYEEDGADGTFVNAIKAQYTPVKINAQTGFYGVLIPKSQLEAGKYYMLRWVPTVDAVNTGAVEIYFITSSSDFKADVTNLDAAVSTRAAADVMAASLTALSVLINAIDTSTETKARFDEIKGAGWTDETLKAIKDAVDAIRLENFNGDGT